MNEIFKTSQKSGRLPLLLIAVAAVGFAQAPIPLQGTITFNPNPVAVGAPSTMTISITNGNNPSLGNTNFIDNFPAGQVVSASPNVLSPCGGQITATAGSTTL